MIARSGPADDPLVLIASTGDGTTIRAGSLCDLTLDRGLRSITIQPSPDAASELTGLLVLGLGLSTLLTPQGRSVIHASAAEVGGLAMAFAGGSGQGKSTLAALMCASGGALITDDLLRLEVDDDAVSYWRGTTELRLRSASLAAAAGWSGRGRLTTDGRVAVSAPRVTEQERGRLDAIVIPMIDSACRTLEVSNLRGPPALIALLRATRGADWYDSQVARTRLAVMAELAARLPVFAVRLPWTLPRPIELAAQLHERIAAALSRQR